MNSTLIEYTGSTPDDKKLFDVASGKVYMRVEFDHEDELIESQIATSVQACESFCKRSFLLQKRLVSFEFPHAEDLKDICSRGLFLDYGPVQGIESVQLVAKGASVAALTEGTDFWRNENHLYFDTDAMMAKRSALSPQFIKITYSCGLTKADFLSKFPSLVEAVKIVLHNVWDGRGFNNLDIPPQAKQKMAPFKIINFDEV